MHNWHRLLLLGRIPCRWELTHVFTKLYQTMGDTKTNIWLFTQLKPCKKEVRIFLRLSSISSINSSIVVTIRSITLGTERGIALFIHIV